MAVWDLLGNPETSRWLATGTVREYPGSASSIRVQVCGISTSTATGYSTVARWMAVWGPLGRLETSRWSGNGKSHHAEKKEWPRRQEQTQQEANEEDCERRLLPKQPQE